LKTGRVTVTEEEALNYHKSKGVPGKYSIKPTKSLINQKDLSLA